MAHTVKLRRLPGLALRIGRRRATLADATLKTCTARLDARLDEHMARQPMHGVIAKIRRDMFVFVTNRDLPVTNNGSERTARRCGVFRKIINRLRTDWGARLCADICPVVETGRRRAIIALDATRLTLAGKPLPTAV